MIFKIIMTIVLTAASAVLYRMGGSARYDTKYRDIGTSVCTNLGIALWFDWHWSLILCFGIMWGSLTTYWDFINKWLPVQDKDKEYWWNWLLHGFFNALSALPFVFFNGEWEWLWTRCAACAVITMLVSVLSAKDVVEENGRGAAPVITIPLKVIYA